MDSAPVVFAHDAFRAVRLEQVDKLIKICNRSIGLGLSVFRNRGIGILLGIVSGGTPAASSPSVWSPVESEPAALSAVSPVAVSPFVASSSAPSPAAPVSLDPDPVVTSLLVSPLSAASDASADAAAISLEMFCQPAATAATVGEHAWSTTITVMNSASMRFAVLIDSVPLILKTLLPELLSLRRVCQGSSAHANAQVAPAIGRFAVRSVKLTTIEPGSMVNVAVRFSTFTVAPWSILKNGSISAFSPT